jgi:ferritin-like metal-binding protein YciE
LYPGVKAVCGRILALIVNYPRFRKGTDAMKMDSLREMFVEELKDLYNAENQLLKALPKMAKAATSAELKRAFESHLKETKVHVERLEEVFSSLDEAAKGKKCKAMEGLVEEGAEWMEEDADPDVMDAGLIACAQRVEHYEMAGYGCVRTYAQVLGETKAAKLLQKTLDEEGAVDKKLTQLAERINVEANEVEDDEEAAPARKGKRQKATSGSR